MYLTIPNKFGETVRLNRETRPAGHPTVRLGIYTYVSLFRMICILILTITRYQHKSSPQRRKKWIRGDGKHLTLGQKG